MKPELGTAASLRDLRRTRLPELSDFTYQVHVRAETREQADQVIEERIQHDEDYGFRYSIDSSIVVHDWQPIDTYPTDKDIGELVWVFCEGWRSEPGLILTPIAAQFFSVDGIGWVDERGHDFYGNPTHWQHIVLPDGTKAAN